MKIGSLHRWSMTGTPALAALGVVSGSTLLAGTAAALIAVLVATSGQLQAGRRSRLRTWLTHGLTVAILVAAGLLFQVAQIDSVLIVVMLGIFNRFVLRQGPRDDFIIAGAASVLVAATTTITAGVAFAFLLLLYVPVMLWALWSSLLLGAAEEVPPQQRERVLRQLSLRPVPKQRLFIAVASIGLMLAGYVVVSFFPRYNFGRFVAAGYFMPLAGAHSTMSLGTGGVRGGTGGAVVLRVEPHPQAGSRPMEGMYARVYTLDEFNGQTWSANSDPVQFPLFARRSRDTGRSSSWHADDSPQTLKVTQERLIRPATMQPIATLGWTAPSSVKVRHPKRDVAGTWFAWFPTTAAKLTYKVVPGEVPELRPLPAYQRTKVAVRQVELPPTVDPRILKLGERLSAGLSTDAEKISAVLAHFDRGYTYSLDALPGEDDDALVRFVFEAKRGHCELYAGAVAVLLRAGGVRAKVATGYYGGWWNARGGYLEFSQADGHAWVEAYDSERGWIWVDATPVDLRARRENKPFALFSDFYDALEAMWFDNIVDFDDRKRRALLGDLAELFDPSGGPMGASSGGSGGGRSVAKAGIGLVAGLGLLLVLVAVIWMGLRRRGPTADRLGHELRRLLNPDAAPHEPLGQLLVALPHDKRASARPVVALYESLRFAAPSDAPDITTVASAVRELGKALREDKR